MQTWLTSSAAQKETQRSMIQQRAYSAKPTPPRKKGSKAIKFSAVQMAVLVKLYRKDDRPATKKQQLIAEVLNLEIHQIRTWFNNQRARNFPAGKEHSSQNIPDDLDIFVNNY
ncbi:oocyte-specific homeobox protein 8-like [Mytilus trossulus]